MKLTITREDLRQFVLRESNIDIGQTPIDIDIEGYKQMEGRYKWQETTDKELKEILRNTSSCTQRCAGGKDIDSVAADRKIITDNEGRVLDIVKEEKEPKKAKVKNKWGGNLKSHPDYTDYENTVLDFATSPEHKRQVPFFGAETIQCCKARYQKMITRLGVKESVKFSRINSLPYLVKREGQESMNDILNEGVNK
jgi:hypothetical protein